MLKRNRRIKSRASLEAVQPSLVDDRVSSSNPALQQELERLYNMRLGVDRILRLRTSPLQRLEAAKTFQVVNLKLMSCLRLAQQEQVAGRHSSGGTAAQTTGAEGKTGDECRADVVAKVPQLRRCANPGRVRLCILDLLPHPPQLKHKLIQIIMNRICSLSSSSSFLTMTGSLDSSATPGADTDDLCVTSDDADTSGSYSVFCVVRVGEVIKDTRLIFDIRPNTADVEFDDSLVFEDVSSDFQLFVEVYAHPRSTVRPNNWKRSWYLDSARKFTEIKLTASPVQHPAKMYYCKLINRCLLATRVKNREEVENDKPVKGLSRSASEPNEHSTNPLHRTGSDQSEVGAEGRTTATWKVPKPAFSLPITPMTMLLDSSPQLRSVDVAFNIPEVDRSRSQSGCLTSTNEPDNGHAPVPVSSTKSPVPGSSSNIFNGDAEGPKKSDQTCYQNSVKRALHRCLSQDSGMARSVCGAKLLPEPNGIMKCSSLESVDSKLLEDTVSVFGQTLLSSLICLPPPDAVPVGEEASAETVLCRQSTDGLCTSSTQDLLASPPEHQDLVSVTPVDMFTFRVATQSSGRGECPTSECNSEVFEIASSSYEVNGQLADQISDQLATSHWLTALQKHIEEQKTWGDAAFSSKLVIPSATSTVCGMSAKRSSVMPLLSQLERIGHRISTESTTASFPKL